MAKLKWESNDLVLVLKDKDNNKLGSFYIKELPSHIRKELLFYGLKQKLSDSVAGKQDLQEKVRGIRDTWEQLKNGDWEKRQSPKKYKQKLLEIKELLKENRIEELEKLLEDI